MRRRTSVYRYRRLDSTIAGVLVLSLASEVSFDKARLVEEDMGPSLLGARTPEKMLIFLACTIWTKARQVRQ